MGLVELVVACDGGLQGMLAELTKSTDHPSRKVKASCKLKSFARNARTPPTPSQSIPHIQQSLYIYI